MSNKNLIVEFDGPYPISETEQSYIATIKDLKIVEAGRTKQEAFDEVVISMGVLLAYNTGMKLNLHRNNKQATRIYYTEFPTGEFEAKSDEEALQISTAKFIYKESDTTDGRPFIVLRDAPDDNYNDEHDND